MSDWDQILIKNILTEEEIGRAWAYAFDIDHSKVIVRFADQEVHAKSDSVIICTVSQIEGDYKLRIKCSIDSKFLNSLPSKVKADFTRRLASFLESEYIVLFPNDKYYELLRKSGFLDIGRSEFSLEIKESDDCAYVCFVDLDSLNKNGFCEIKIPDLGFCLPIYFPDETISFPSFILIDRRISDGDLKVVFSHLFNVPNTSISVVEQVYGSKGILNGETRVIFEISDINGDFNMFIEADVDQEISTSAVKEYGDMIAFTERFSAIAKCNCLLPDPASTDPELWCFVKDGKRYQYVYLDDYVTEDDTYRIREVFEQL